jgi:alkyl hydroperoxide reductase subunit F
MLSDDIKAQLTGYLQRLQRPIELVASYDDSPAGQEMRALMSDIVSCSDQVSVREDTTLALKPSFGIAAAGQAPRVRFAGLPMGHEFTSLVLALLHVGGHPPKVGAETIEQIRALEGDLHFEVFMSLSCHNCPDVVQALNMIAALNPNVRSTSIDGALFQDEAQRRDVMAVPALFLNGEPFASGRMSVAEILAKLDVKSAQRGAAKLNAEAPFDVLVVGGGPAGCAAAVYAARKGIRTGLVAERLGGQTNDTLSIENYISVLETQGPKFALDLESHVRQYGVEVMTLQRVARLVPATELGGLAEVHTESGGVLKARAVVLATGARWRNVDVPGEHEYRNKGVAYCPHCDGPLFKGKRVAVIGGGNSGVEAAIDLAGVVAHVTLLEYDTRLKADAVLVDKLHSLPNVSVRLGAQTTEITGDGNRVHGLRYVDRVAGGEQQLDLEGVFVQIGLVPNTDFLKGTVELNRFGEVPVDEKCQTRVAGVFAAGDATTVPYKQIVVAAGEGAKAALSAFEHLVRTPVPKHHDVAGADAIAVSGLPRGLRQVLVET